MIVSFPFTFTFTVPGLPNPFSQNYSQQTSPPKSLQASAEPGKPSEPASQAVIQKGKDSRAMAVGGRLASLPAPSFSPSTPGSKSLKRGWEPAFAETSQSSTTLVSTSGYLDPPSKYMEFVDAQAMHEEESCPPSKRRRGLAGSIVSTAVNAALIGTAVGLTVYRLWRGRGKETHAIEAADPASPDSDNGVSHQFPPPPPYQEREWTPISYPVESAPPLSPATPTTPRRKVVQRSVKKTRRPRAPRPQAAQSPGRVGPSGHSHTEPNFGRDGEGGGDDQMDWIQDRLAQLIQEGKRALNREVVVMSDAQEDEVDDGSGAWEEEDNGHDRHHHYQSASSIERAGSLRRGTKRSRAQAHFYGTGNGSNHSPSSSTTIAPMTPRRTHTKAFSADAAMRGITKEEENAWESPELRETMRLARERILAGRGMP